MREIKFRAWDKEKNEITTTICIGGLHIPYNSNPNNYILMQYTGLKDKNGKEIYEGDIVTGQYSHYDPLQDAYIEDEKMGGIVFFNEHKWSFKAIQHLCDKDREGKMRYFDLFDEKLHWGGQRFGDMEVIGNVYENPELLK